MSDYRRTIALPITGGPGGVGVGSIVRRKSDGCEHVVVAFDPPTCTTVVTWVAGNGKSNTTLIDTCDYDGKPCKPWEVVRAVEPYEPTEGTSCPDCGGSGSGPPELGGPKPCPTCDEGNEVPWPTNHAWVDPRPDDPYCAVCDRHRDEHSTTYQPLPDDAQHA